MKLHWDNNKLKKKKKSKVGKIIGPIWKWRKRTERRNKDLERKRKTKKDMADIYKERESSSGSLVEEDGKLLGTPGVS